MSTGRKKAIEIARLALDKKASDVVVLELEGLVAFTDYFVICSGANIPQVKAITDHVLESLSRRRKSPLGGMESLSGKKTKPLGVEGEKAGRWVLMDYGDVIVHVFEEETRRYYELEKLWLDAPRIPVPDGEEKTSSKKKAAVN